MKKTSSSKPKKSLVPKKSKTYKISNSSTSSYIKDIPGYILTKQEQLHYGKLFQTGTAAQKKEAMEKLISSSLYFVINIAKNMGFSGLELDDLIQEGNVGLIKAVERYDYQKGLAFTTYAIWWVRQSIFKAIKDKSTNVRLPSHVYELERKINKQEEKLRRKGISIDLKILAKNLGKKVEQIKKHKINLKMKHTQNLEEIFAKSETFLSTEKENDFLVFNRIAHEEVKEIIHRLLLQNVLNERETNIICLRYGFVDKLTAELLKKYQQFTQTAALEASPTSKAGLTLAQSSQIIGISKERVRQIEASAIIKLKQYTNKHKHFFNDLI